MNNLKAISPLDGRYFKHIEEMSEYFSEYGLIRMRVDVEIEYFIFLSTFIPELSEITDDNVTQLRKISSEFSEEDACVVKKIEEKTRHDVKSVEYFLRMKFEDLGLERYISFIHFGLTSEDINSVVYVTQLWKFKSCIYNKLVHEILDVLLGYGTMYKDIPMLSRTHGQAATPTTVGKEFMVYHERILNVYTHLRKIDYKTKFGGAVGRLNAHVVAYPDVDWHSKMNDFIAHYSHRKDFMMGRHRYTTQIDHYENYSMIYDIIRRINCILVDLCVDMWLYISMDYFKMSVVKDEVGSSAMPHKVNPIMFENAEGNLLLSNSLLSFLSNKLPVSRLQRDLSSSTVLRNVGVALSHTILSFKNIILGLKRISLDEDVVLKDLKNNPVVIAEAIQSILRSRGCGDAYELMKAFVRSNKKISEVEIHNFIKTLNIDNTLKKRLLTLSPINYIGI